MSYTDEDLLLEDKYIMDLINNLDELEKRVFQSDLLAESDFSTNQPMDYTEDE